MHRAVQRESRNFTSQSSPAGGGCCLSADLTGLPPLTGGQQDRAMGERDLSQIRRDIDNLDRQLVALLAKRAQLVEQVVVYKRSHHMAVVDRGREDEMLARIANVAKEEGLDPRVAQQVLRTVIDGFTLLEAEELGPEL